MRRLNKLKLTAFTLCLKDMETAQVFTLINKLLLSPYTPELGDAYDACLSELIVRVGQPFIPALRKLLFFCVDTSLAIQNESI